MEPFDCEILRAAGFPEQPVNTWSSLVFLAAAVVLWRRRHRIAGAALVLAGVGSIAFHGAPSGASEWMHDIGLYAAVAIAAVETWRRTASGRFPVVALVVFALGVGVWALSRTGGPLCSPESLLQGHAVWHAVAAAAVVILFLAPHRSGVRASIDV